MGRRCKLSLLRLGTMLALASVLAACTKGGQFDPTTLLDNDMFANKKPLTGQREPVFPNGVPGATTGIPPDLYKGYQPPPEQTANAVGAATSIVPPAEEPAKPKPKLKPKPKPKLARAPASRPRISIGLARRPKAATPQEPQPAQTNWPVPPSTAQAQPAQTDWPAPPPTGQAQPSQSIWPAPPPTGASPQTAQPSQSIWPNPPATGASSQ